MIARLTTSLGMGQVLTYAGSLTAMLFAPIAQFALFAFYARVLGVSQYGLYISLMAWAPICFELIGVGAGEVLIKHVSRDKTKFSAASGHFYAAFALSLPVALAIYVASTKWLVGSAISLPTITALGLCEMAGMRLFMGCESFAIASGRMRWANEFRIMQAMPRLIAVLGAYQMFEARSMTALALAGSAGLLVGGIAAAAIAYVRFPRPVGGLDNGKLREGLWFSGNQLARAAQQNVDRVVLAVVLEPAVLGLFGAAQRFVQVGIIPIQAALRMTYPKFFSHGDKGVGAAVGFGIKVLVLVVSLAMTSAVVLWLAASQVPTALGHQFAQSAIYLRWLAPTLLLSALNYVAADILTGTDHQKLRTGLMLSSIGIQAAMYALFHNPSGLVLAAYAGLTCAAAANWGAVLYLRRSENRQISHVEAITHV